MVKDMVQIWVTKKTRREAKKKAAEQDKSIAALLDEMFKGKGGDDFGSFPF